MTERAPVVGVTLGVVTMLFAYGATLFPPIVAAAPWLMVGGMSLLLLALFWLGARSSRRRLPAVFGFGMAFVAVVLLAGFGAALLLPPESAAGPLLLGLPRRAALLIYGIGLLPIPVLPVVYALSFDRTVLNQADLTELRVRLEQLRGESPAP